MMISKRCSLVSALFFAIAAARMPSVDASAGPATGSLQNGFHAPLPRRGGRPIQLRAKAATAAGASYTIVDYGEPATALQSGPRAFNNTGQIAGFANFAAKGGNSTCVLFDGSRYRNISSSMSINSCSVNGMSDENAATGSVDVVGSTLTAYAGQDNKAFLSAVTPKSNAIRTTIFPNDASSLTGVNAAGTAIGVGFYNPLAGFPTNSAPFFVAPGKDALSVLQPSCSAIHYGCGSLRVDYAMGTRICPFGGCEITADGSVLLVDLFTGSFEVVAPNGTAADVDLGANVGESPGDDGPIINNAKQILYSTSSYVAGVTVTQTHLYDVATGHITTVPPIPGSTCAQYVPFAFNDAGRVLGNTEQCANAADYTEFIYDPKTGTRDLSSELPGGTAAVHPIAINDVGQILIDVSYQNGVVNHWGILNPINSTSVRRGAKAAVGTAGSTYSADSRARAVASAQSTRPTIHSRAAARENRVGLDNAVPKPRPLHLRARTAPRSGQQYTIVDRGAPPSSGYVLQNPVAFNNTGQIVGQASSTTYPNSYTCEFFDGARYRSISASASITNCTPASMSDENASSGSVAVVGQVYTAFATSEDPKAFISKVTLKSGFVGTTVFAADDESALVGVNTSGRAIGYGIYTPVTGFLGGPTFVVAPGQQSITLLQPQCATIQPGCGGPYSRGCAFGGCSITADGTLFLADDFAESYELIAPNGTVHDLNLSDNGYFYGPAIINNAMQLLYSAITSGPSNIVTELYEIATRHITTVPLLPGNSCSEYIPLSFNNAGRVLGRTSLCPNNDATFFTYDAMHGTQDVLAGLPSGNASVTAVGINDNDQILVELTFDSGVNHWGILQPSASTSGGNRTDARLRRPAGRVHF